MTFEQNFLARSRHYLCAEYPAKIELCLRHLPTGAVWARANVESNSIGNLLLHLEGNVRQWLLSGVGGQPDHRYRAGEFAAINGTDAKALFADLRRTLGDVDLLLGTLTTNDLASRRVIQDRNVSVFDAIYHVVEHFSMHTGQIILMTKAAAPGTVKFYEDAGGKARPLY